jgi:hypothetical protein
MHREIGTVAFAVAVSLGTWISALSGAKGESSQTLMHAGLSGPLDDWKYSGQVIATKFKVGSAKVPYARMASVSSSVKEVGHIKAHFGTETLLD